MPARGGAAAVAVGAHRHSRAPRMPDQPEISTSNPAALTTPTRSSRRRRRCSSATINTCASSAAASRRCTRARHQQARNLNRSRISTLTNPQAGTGDEGRHPRAVERVEGGRRTGPCRELRKAVDGIDEILTQSGSRLASGCFEEQMERRKLDLLIRARQNARDPTQAGRGARPSHAKIVLAASVVVCLGTHAVLSQSDRTRLRIAGRRRQRRAGCTGVALVAAGTVSANRIPPASRPTSRPSPEYRPDATPARGDAAIDAAHRHRGQLVPEVRRRQPEFPSASSIRRSTRSAKGMSAARRSLTSTPSASRRSARGPTR